MLLILTQISEMLQPQGGGLDFETGGGVLGLMN